MIATGLVALLCVRIPLRGPRIREAVAGVARIGDEERSRSGSRSMEKIAIAVQRARDAEQAIGRSARSDASDASRAGSVGGHAPSHHLYAHADHRDCAERARAASSHLGERRHHGRSVPHAAHAGPDADAPERLADARADQPEQGGRQVHRLAQPCDRLRDGGGLHRASRRRRSSRPGRSQSARTPAGPGAGRLPDGQGEDRGPADPPQHRQPGRAAGRRPGDLLVRTDALADDGRHDPRVSRAVSRSPDRVRRAADPLRRRHPGPFLIHGRDDPAGRGVQDAQGRHRAVLRAAQGFESDRHRAQQVARAARARPHHAAGARLLAALFGGED